MRQRISRPTRLVTLGYHDVTMAGTPEESGFSGPAAEYYKLERAQFVRHLEMIAACVSGPPTTTRALAAGVPERSLLLTFDDGGSSAMTVADLLDERGWHGHFFVPTDMVGARGFLTSGQIVELARRGHVVGSHSCSHPPRMWTMRWDALVSEWRRSVEALAMVLGTAVDVASVPGGFYARRVARAASRAGICVLFTSEPVSRASYIDDCLVAGRFRILRTTKASEAAALAVGRSAPAMRQWAAWQAKKVAKVLVGPGYEWLGRALSSRTRPGVTVGDPGSG